jgi:hypothetical protein
VNDESFNYSSSTVSSKGRGGRGSGGRGVIDNKEGGNYNKNTAGEGRGRGGLTGGRGNGRAVKEVNNFSSGKNSNATKEIAVLTDTEQTNKGVGGGEKRSREGK